MLMLLGGILFLAGLAVTAASSMGMVRLPGDLVARRGNFTFFFPLMTCILLSIALSVIFWFFRSK
jgi:hypothetical protein